MPRLAGRDSLADVQSRPDQTVDVDLGLPQVGSNADVRRHEMRNTWGVPLFVWCVPVMGVSTRCMADRIVTAVRGV